MRNRGRRKSCCNSPLLFFPLLHLFRTPLGPPPTPLFPLFFKGAQERREKFFCFGLRSLVSHALQNPFPQGLCSGKLGVGPTFAAKKRNNAQNAGINIHPSASFIVSLQHLNHHTATEYQSAEHRGPSSLFSIARFPWKPFSRESRLLSLRIGGCDRVD